MAYILYNPNPSGSYVGDCVIRAISKVTGKGWDDAYVGLAVTGFALKDMPSSNHVWGVYLKNNGFRRIALPDTCPDCYSVSEFCDDNPSGRFILATGSHAVAVIEICTSFVSPGFNSYASVFWNFTFPSYAETVATTFFSVLLVRFVTE